MSATVFFFELFFLFDEPPEVVRVLQSLATKVLNDVANHVQEVDEPVTSSFLVDDGHRSEVVIDEALQTLHEGNFRIQSAFLRVCRFGCCCCYSWI